MLYTVAASGLARFGIMPGPRLKRCNSTSTAKKKQCHGWDLNHRPKAYNSTFDLLFDALSHWM